MAMQAVEPSSRMELIMVVVCQWLVRSVGVEPAVPTGSASAQPRQVGLGS